MAFTNGVVLQFGAEGGMELAVILLLAVILFGANKLPALSGGLVGVFQPGEVLGPSQVTPDVLMEYDDAEFEDLVSRVWEAKGYATQTTGGGPDQGIDVIANNPSETIVIEAKRYGPDSKVSAPTIQKAVGAKEQFQADRAVVVTSTDFTDPAREAAAHTNVELVNGWELAGGVNAALNE